MATNSRGRGGGVEAGPVGRAVIRGAATGVEVRGAAVAGEGLGVVAGSRTRVAVRNAAVAGEKLGVVAGSGARLGVMDAEGAGEGRRVVAGRGTGMAARDAAGAGEGLGVVEGSGARVGGEGRGVGWGRTWGDGDERSTGGGEGRWVGGRRTWDSGRERRTDGGEGSGVDWGRTSDGGGERSTGGVEGCGGGRGRAWGGGGERNTADGYRRPPDWKEWLWKYLEVPRGEKQEKDVYYEDELCVVIYDGFPKAKYHLLLIAKDSSVKQPTDLRREHLPSRRRLHDVGRAIAEALSQQGAGAVRCGYHAIPSHEPLHMHIISQDFDAPRLKRPSHWNSFTTDFFLDYSWVERQLEELGSLELDMNMYKRLEKQPMLCFRCGWEASGMGSLKKHNLECTAPLPGGATASRSKSA